MGQKQSKASTATQTLSAVDASVDKLTDEDPISKETDDDVNSPPKEDRGWRFWSVILTLCLIGFAASLDNTIVFTALPTIAQSQGNRGGYVWIADSYVIASVAIQPTIGQLSNIYGRRWPMLVSVALFALGAGIAGGSYGYDMLVAGRTVQGLGCGGIFVLMDIIVSDLTSQRERGKYLGLVLAFAGLGSTLGPVIGGALTLATWRWVFYISLPFAGIALVSMFFILQLKVPDMGSATQRIARIDWIGNVIFIGSMTSLILGLLMGGNTHPWSSANVIVPIVIGAVSWAVFHFWEASDYVDEPVVPPSLFGTRTSCIGFINTFVFGMIIEWTTYFLPLYFQALKGRDALLSGVDTLPLSALLMPAGMLAGGLMTKIGRFRRLHAIAFSFMALGLGLFSNMDAQTSIAEWVWWQFFVAIGLGFVFVTILPAIQAALPESALASATGVFSFMRSFGIVWGITIPSVIFNAEINSRLDNISDPMVRSALADGGAYGAAAGGSLSKLEEPLRGQVTTLYTDALKRVWWAALAFALFGFVLVFGEKHVQLREEASGDYGIRDDGKPTEDVELA